MKSISKIFLGLILLSGLAVAVIKLLGQRQPAIELEASLWPQVEPPARSAPKINVLPGPSIYQGETVRIELVRRSSDDEPPASVSFKGKDYSLFEYQGNFNAVIPLATDVLTGQFEILIGSETSTISILPGIFQTEELGPFKPLTAAELVQRQGETKAITAAYQTVAPEIYFDSPFIPPLKELFETSPFGVQRTERGTGRKLEPHNGVDLRADIGTPVVATNDGVIEIAEIYLLEGGFILLDHGFGINSGYLHLSRVDVKKGEKIIKGQTIGLTGGSGMSAGPHLHFMVKINGIAVDPLRFLTLW